MASELATRFPCLPRLSQCPVSQTLEMGKEFKFPSHHAAGIQLHLLLPPYLDPPFVLDVCGLKFIWVQKIVQLLQFSLYLTSKNMDIQLIFVQIYWSMLSIKLESSEGESGEEEYN